MKNYLTYTGIIILTICSFLLGKDFIPLFYHGIKVDYQRSTGPEYSVIEGEESLKKIIGPTEKDLNYSELYVTNELEDSRGFLKAKSVYIINGDYVGYRSLRENSPAYPVLNLTYWLSKSGYYFQGIIFLVTFISLVLLVMFVIPKGYQNK